MSIQRFYVMVDMGFDPPKVIHWGHYEPELRRISYRSASIRNVKNLKENCTPDDICNPKEFVVYE